MTQILQLSRNSDAVLNGYSGNAGEVCISTADWRPRTYDGSTVGGHKLALFSDFASVAITGGAITGTSINNCVIGQTTPAAAAFTTISGSSLSIGTGGGSFGGTLAVTLGGMAITGAVSLLTIATATSATAGSASALPSVPVGYIEVTIAGTLRKIPYYAT